MPRSIDNLRLMNGRNPNSRMSRLEILESLTPWRAVPFPLGLLSEAVWRMPERRAVVDETELPEGGGYDRSDGRAILAADASNDDSGVRPPLATDAGAAAMREETARETHRKENRWPSLVHEPDRRKSILQSTPGRFDIADNPDGDWNTPWYSVHRDGYNGVKRHDSRIEREAKRFGVDPDLVRAIAYVEYANGYSYGGPAQWVGAAGSLYPMNIRPDLWAGLVGDADLNDFDANVRAGVLLLKRIAERLSDPSIAKIATLYNNLAGDEVSDYGAQVARAYRDRLWTARTMP